MAIKDRRILIVGGSSGIGFAVAEAALAAGATVEIASSNEARLSTAKQNLAGRATTHRLDLRDEAAVKAFFERGTERYDHIVSTAGDWGSFGPRTLSDLALTDAPNLFQVRFWGALALAKYGARVLSPGGSLTVTTGMIAHRPIKGMSVATAMAGAIEHLTRGLAVELAPQRVNAVCPGLIRTGIWDRIPAEQRAQELTRMTATQLIPRVGEPEEAAQAYLYLMSCGYVTGQVLYVDGGTR